MASFHEVQRWRSLLVSGLTDLLDDLADAAFGGRGGMGGNMTIITGPRLTDQCVPGTALGSAV